MTLNDVISSRFGPPTIPDKCEKLRDRGLSDSLETPNETVGGGIFGGVFRANFRREVVSDVLSDLTLECVGMNVPVKFCESRSNRSRDIRAAHCVMDDERMTPAYGGFTQGGKSA